MRPLLATFLSTLAWLGMLVGYTKLVANSRYLYSSRVALRDWAHAVADMPPEAVNAIEAEARHRARLYDDQIQRHHLVDGMIVNRDMSNGRMLDQCDSLLFSSLRFVSLEKLGWHERAQVAWRGIQNAFRGGYWLRHPRCPRSTSRDMLLGLLAALSQRPEGFSEHLRSLIATVGANDGYFGSGPIYVSYLSPGLARIMAMLTPASKLQVNALPSIIREGYSTAELEVLVTRRGFESHLGGLTTWVEMELDQQLPRTAAADPGPLADAVDFMIAPFAAEDMEHQRLDWITDQLVQRDRNNLFFRYLRLRSADALTPAIRHRLLAELIDMPEFPRQQLPGNCERRADYLWQRADWRPVEPPRPCNEQYNGTDFLWMASLLLENLPQHPPG